MDERVERRAAAAEKHLNNLDKFRSGELQAKAAAWDALWEWEATNDLYDGSDFHEAARQLKAELEKNDGKTRP